MSNLKYTGEIQNRATSSENLAARLATNAKGSSRDFHAWMMSHLKTASGKQILDVGCGMGAQTLPISIAVGPSGSVSALDFSPDSIKHLKANDKIGNIDAFAGNMDDLDRIIDRHFQCKSYDIAQSAYAIYYANEPIKVIETMHDHLRNDGQLAITVPCLPHGLVDLAARFTSIPLQTEQSLEIGLREIRPWFHQTFWEPSIHMFKNLVYIENVEDLLTAFRATVYYDKAVELPISEIVSKAIRDRGVFIYEKNGMMISGTRGN